jgi:hypothetical protein
MHKAQLDRFIEYYLNYRYQGPYNPIEIISHLYEKFGREFIHDLPVEYRSVTVPYIVIQGTAWVHSTTEPAYCGVDNQYRFYMLGYRLSLDEWLPYSALSPEEQIMFKLKYG